MLLEQLDTTYKNYFIPHTIFIYQNELKWIKFINVGDKNKQFQKNNKATLYGFGLCEDFFDTLLKHHTQKKDKINKNRLNKIKDYPLPKHNAERIKI